MGIKRTIERIKRKSKYDTGGSGESNFCVAFIGFEVGVGSFPKLKRLLTNSRLQYFQDNITTLIVEVPTKFLFGMKQLQ